MDPFAYERFAKAMREIFGRPGEHENELVLFAFFFGTLALFWLVYQVITPPEGKKTPKKDLEFFDMVINQKGLETFDRDLLLEISETYSISPVYKVLMDEKIFDRVLGKIHEDIEKKRGNARILAKKDYLFKLRQRLFSHQAPT